MFCYIVLVFFFMNSHYRYVSHTLPALYLHNILSDFLTSLHLICILFIIFLPIIKLFLVDSLVTIKFCLFLLFFKVQPIFYLFLTFCVFVCAWEMYLSCLVSELFYSRWFFLIPKFLFEYTSLWGVFSYSFFCLLFCVGIFHNWFVLDLHILILQ